MNSSTETALVVSSQPLNIPCYLAHPAITADLKETNSFESPPHLAPMNPISPQDDVSVEPDQYEIWHAKYQHVLDKDFPGLLADLSAPFQRVNDQAKELLEKQHSQFAALTQQLESYETSVEQHCQELKAKRDKVVDHFSSLDWQVPF